MPKLCHTSGKLVGVARFELATPSSRTKTPPPKSLNYRAERFLKTVNGARTFAYFCAVSVPMRTLQARTRAALEHTLYPGASINRSAP